MLKLMNIDDFVKNLKPVSSTIYTDRSGGFHEDGLFSERIFGPDGTKERRTIFSYIDLNASVIHPAALKILLQLDRKIEKYISTELSFDLDDQKRLITVEKGGFTGIKEFVKIFPKIKFRGDTETREKLILFVNKELKRKTIFISKIPVIPPELRPAIKQDDGNWMIDPINDVYVSIIRKASQVRSSGTGPLYDLLNYALQIAVVNHDDFVRSKIAKKSGIIRKVMLGKRVDFSGRAVITPDPSLNINEVGLPFRMAIGLFEPFIMHRLLYSGKIDKEMLERNIKEYSGLELSVDSVKKVFKAIKEDDKIPEELYNMLYEITEVVIKDRLVILKRDPVLQTQSYMGYKPILHKGGTLKLSTLQVTAHSADFDGDTMAIFHPLTDESQREIREKMLQITSGTSSNSFSFGFNKEMWVGLYIITKSKKSSGSISISTDEDLQKYNGDLYKSIKYRGVNTTVGKAIFNSCFPKTMPFIDEIATKKLVEKMIITVFNKYGQEVTENVINKMKDMAFKWATLSGPSITIDHFELPKRIYEIKEKIKTSTPEEAQKLLDEAQKIIKKELEETGFGDLVESGSAKGWGQPMQILVAKGITADPNGNLLPAISGSFSDGLNNIEYFNASQGARKGIVDRVINTSDTGYLSRKLAYFLNTVELDRTLKDCGTTRTLTLKVTKDIIKRIKGRYVIKNDKLYPVESLKIEEGDIINLRSPMFCTSPKVCHTCYGRLLERHRTPYVGILAAQTIGERGTQLIMKAFHTGGAVTLLKRNMLEDIISNDPLAGLEL